jgi:hypothetical protein
MDAVALAPSFADQHSRSPWADLYFAHANYNFQQAEFSNSYGDFLAAYKLALLADSVQKVNDFAHGGAFAIDTDPGLLDLPSGSGESDPGIVVRIITAVPTAQEPAGGINTKVSVVSSNNNSAYVQFGLLVFGGLLVFLVFYFLLGRRPLRAPVQTEADLDRMFLDGRISEANYTRMREKYFPQAEPAKPAAPPVAAAKPASERKAAPRKKQQKRRIPG